MMTRCNVYGLGTALCLATLSSTSLSFAQGPEGDATKGEDKSATDSDAPKSASPDLAGEATEEPAAKAPDQDVPKAKPEPPRAPAEAPAPPETAAVKGVGVEILPGAAYPEWRVRGIKTGSMWFNMHGMQWPYMPYIPGRSEVQLGVSGSVWVDTAYARIESGTPDTDASLKRWTNQGRAVLRATPVYSTKEGWFAQGQVELVANGDQLLPSSGDLGAIDDLYARIGKWNVFDITVGRFQGWEVYHYGMGLDLNTLERRGAEGRINPVKPPQIYGVDAFWDRPNGGAGNYAAHLYVTDYLRFELLGQIGTKGGANSTALRPVGILDLGFLKFKAGFEYGHAVPQPDGLKNETSRNGVGASLQFVFNPHLEGGINGAIGYVDSINDKGLRDDAASTTTSSFGAFLNGRVWGPLILGAGVNQTRLENLDKNGVMGSPNLGKGDIWTHLQAFGAVQYSLWDRFLIKFVGSYANFDFQDYIQEPPHSFVNKLYGGRLRITYLF